MNKTYSFLIVFAFFSLSGMAQPKSFKQTQMQYQRVREAYTEKEQYLSEILREKGIKDFNLQIFIRVFKEENKLELWVKTPGQSAYQILKNYEICQSSGELGPKRMQGDRQVPEGVYYINRFNPVSFFHLSLGINYPNASDIVRGEKDYPGGNIFIHGGCATIGCIPLTDDKIKELYILAIEAYEHGQKNIPVHIYPYRFSEEKNKEKFSEYPEHQAFWEELISIYKYFEEHKNPPIVKINSNGKYSVN